MPVAEPPRGTTGPAAGAGADAAPPFLLGGPPFAGKTLLAHLLNQGLLTCLDEPDLHDPGQSHRGIPVLRQLFPGRPLPERPGRALTYAEAADLLRACQAALAPNRLGMKTADRAFLGYAAVFRARGWPVIAVGRDVRDALAEAPLPPWVRGAGDLAARYRLVWEQRAAFDLWVRYEDLVRDPGAVLAGIGGLLGCTLRAPDRWDPDAVHRTMLKLPRHDLLRAGRIARDRVGLWRRAGGAPDEASQRTARLMGYD
jgi:hypothetical protein